MVHCPAAKLEIYIWTPERTFFVFGYFFMERDRNKIKAKRNFKRVSF